MDPDVVAQYMEHIRTGPADDRTPLLFELLVELEHEDFGAPCTGWTLASISLRGAQTPLQTPTAYCRAPTVAESDLRCDRLSLQEPKPMPP